MTIEITPEKFLAHAQALSITEEEHVDELTWPHSAEAEAKPQPKAPKRELTITWVAAPIRASMARTRWRASRLGAR